MARGRFIVFEGPDGAGKTTQVERVARARGGLATRQPGGTALGVKLRELLLDSTHPLDVRAEALLMAADRAEHVAQVIRPTLDSGRDVICDRYMASSVAYQGWGRQLDPAAVGGLSVFAADGLQPDLVILLDLSVQGSLKRLSGERDRFESLGTPFFERVRNGFLAQAQSSPSTWRVIDADQELGRVSDAVDKALIELDGSKKS